MGTEPKPCPDELPSTLPPITGSPYPGPGAAPARSGKARHPKGRISRALLHADPRAENRDAFASEDVYSGIELKKTGIIFGAFLWSGQLNCNQSRAFGCPEE